MMKFKALVVDKNGKRAVEEIVEKEAMLYRRYEYGALVEEREATAEEMDLFTPHGVVTLKSDVWSRATDDEADEIDAIIDAQSTRFRRMWSDAQYIEHTGDVFRIIFAKLEKAFGEQRARELLARSDYVPGSPP